MSASSKAGAQNTGVCLVIVVVNIDACYNQGVTSNGKWAGSIGFGLGYGWGWLMAQFNWFQGCLSMELFRYPI